VNWLQETWARQWQRPPSEQDLRGLVADYLKEELLAREAQELGLDQNDTVVRRRLAQKMEFLVKDTAGLAEPGDDELRRLYDAGHARYQTPTRVSFTQIYFRTETAARQGLEVLATHPTADLGDRTLLEREYAEADEHTVASVFGPEFADKVFALAPSQWQGPIESGYGFHLVWIDDVQAARPRPFEEARAQVVDEWRRTQDAKASEQLFAGLLRKYDVVVDESVKPLIGPLAEVVR
jgi:parvulin-like peptidyl-prolyl isomerase